MRPEAARRRGDYFHLSSIGQQGDEEERKTKK